MHNVMYCATCVSMKALDHVELKFFKATSNILMESKRH